MLRVLVALLLLANVVFLAWSQGWLDAAIGVRAVGDREPGRLAQQVLPETVRVLPPQATAPAPAPTAAAPTPTAAPTAPPAPPASAVAEQAGVDPAAAEPRLTCLEAGPFDDASLGAAETALSATLPSGTWVRATTERPAGWIVYLGRFATREAMQQKAQELDTLGVAHEALRRAPDLEPGLQLGRFAERAEAEQALGELAARGVSGARLAYLTGAPTEHMLRVEGAGPDLAATVTGLRLDALGRGFRPCAPRPS